MTLRVFYTCFFSLSFEWAWTYKFRNQNLGDDKNRVLMHFGVKKNLNFTKMDLRGL